jgi:hypothetical protein
MSLPRYFSVNIVSIENNSALPSSDISNYFEDHKTLVGNYVDETTVVFSKGFAIPPEGVPAPTTENFNFYINGTFLEKIAVVSFTDEVISSTLIIDPNILQYSFELNDKILAIGKFN